MSNAGRSGRLRIRRAHLIARGRRGARHRHTHRGGSRRYQVPWGVRSSRHSICQMFRAMPSRHPLIDEAPTPCASALVPVGSGPIPGWSTPVSPRLCVEMTGHTVLGVAIRRLVGGDPCLGGWLWLLMRSQVGIAGRGVTVTNRFIRCRCHDLSIPRCPGYAAPSCHQVHRALPQGDKPWTPGACGSPTRTTGS